MTVKSNRAKAGTYTAGDVARRCGVSPRTAGKWIDSGTLKGFRIPGGVDRRVHKHDLAEFCLTYGYNLEGLIDDMAVRVVIVGLTSMTAVIKRGLPQAAGFEVTECLNGFHAARIAHTDGCDVIVVDAAIGESTSGEMLANLPVSRHTGERPIALWVKAVECNMPTPEQFDGMFLTDDPTSIVHSIKVEANRLLTYGLKSHIKEKA